MSGAKSTSVGAEEILTPIAPVQTDVGAALAFARQHVDARVMDITDGERTAKVIALPPGVRLTSAKPFLDELRGAPERLRGTAKVTTLPSFMAHVARFKDEGSALFATLGESPSLLAVYDYHPKAGVPRFGQHRAHYAFPLSDAWAAWQAADGREMNQGTFAEFIEEHAGDVLPPTMPEASPAVARLQRSELAAATPTQVLSFSRGIDARVETSITNRVSLATGGYKLIFDETVKGPDGAPLDVPGGFVIGLPLFDGGDAYALAVRLRFRLEKGRALWKFALLGADEVLREAITAAAEQARAASGLPLFYGDPES